MTLVEKQAHFVIMIGQLITHATTLGYTLTWGDAYRDPRVPYGHPRSLHKIRLAVDFNLFKDGKFLSDTKDHASLGLWWESIGGTWGGRFRSPDGNHYSLAHGGMR